jgi:hypothetical protein
MGPTPFFTSLNSSQIIGTDWRFENLNDGNLLSPHVDDMRSTPWNDCDAATCSKLPQPRIGQWQQFVIHANASDKHSYLALSLLGKRCTRAGNDRCLILDEFDNLGGDAIEISLRLIDNMALRCCDGSSLPGQNAWHDYVSRRYQP